jgi:hypothetical protein
MRRNFTRVLAFAAAGDAGNRNMRAAGRTTWNEDDWNIACEELDRLWPTVVISELMK